MLNKAIEIANRVHTGRVDKGGAPYILHPLRIMLSASNDFERICAILHDVVEDSNTTFDDLLDEGISKGVINVLDCLTRRSEESYDKYIDRVIKNKTACRVKLADLRDNMNLSRIENPTTEDLIRIKRYGKAKKKISEALMKGF